MDNTKKLGDYLTSYTAERIQKMMDIKAGACMVTGCDVEDYLTEYAENLKAMIGIVVRSKVSQSIELSEIGLHLESELLKSLGYDIGREVHRISHALTNDYTGFNSAEYSHHLNCYALEFEKELSRIIDSKLVQLISLSGSKKGGDNVSFCENLKKLREEKELSQAELAKLVGISQGAIGQYELNIKQPGVTVAGKIARVLGTTVDDMLWGE